tara:strand:- start:20161 stop:20631 length:471 start_codon:yes stop_codon:yes gene_type:complete
MNITYDKNTGDFFRELNSGKIKKIGVRYRNRNVIYLKVTVNKRAWPLHRLAFLLVNGVELPSNVEVDHLDGNGLNNKWCNLRFVKGSENQKNRLANKNTKFGLMGIRFIDNHWQARICVNRKRIHLGCFDNKLDAAAARISANNKHGFTERHGRLK